MVPRRAKTMSEHSTTKESAAGAMAGATATGYRVSLVPGALEVSARLASNEELEILVKVLEANKGSLGKPADETYAAMALTGAASQGRLRLTLLAAASCGSASATVGMATPASS
jgi:hypothetical protein